MAYPSIVSTTTINHPAEQTPKTDFFFFFFLKSALDYGFPTLYITHSAGCLLAVNCWLPACLVGVALSIPGSFRPLHVAPQLSHAGCELLAACMFDWCCLGSLRRLHVSPQLPHAGCELLAACMFDWCCFGSLRRLHVASHLSHAGCELLAACMFDCCCLIYTWVLQATTCILSLIHI